MSPCPARALRNSLPDTTACRSTRYHRSPGASPRGLAFTSLVFNGSTPLCLASASSFEANGPSLTAQISSLAAVRINSCTCAGSSTPGSCTRIWKSAPRPAVGGHGLLGQAESVDAVGDGVDGALHGLPLESDQVRGFQLQGVVAGGEHGDGVRRIMVGYQAAERAGLGGGDALDREGHIAGFLHLLHFVDGHVRPGDGGLLQIVLQMVHGLVGVAHYGFVHFDQHHQVAAAPQIQAQADIVPEVLFQFRHRFGDPDDADYADQDRRNDDDRPGVQILFHGS